MIFPSGYNWIYYFNHSKIYPGGTTSYFGIPLNETASWMRSNSIIPIKQQLWLVYLEKGNVSRTILGGDYSYDFVVNYDGERL